VHDDRRSVRVEELRNREVVRRELKLRRSVVEDEEARHVARVRAVTGGRRVVVPARGREGRDALTHAVDVEAVEAGREAFGLRAHDHVRALLGQLHHPGVGSACIDELDLDLLA
jgi:hypothetical protein